ncbi:hypothetical protein ACJBU6_03953 [Exserohilum turcicum]
MRRGDTTSLFGHNATFQQPITTTIDDPTINLDETPRTIKEVAQLRNRVPSTRRPRTTTQHANMHIRKWA